MPLTSYAPGVRAIVFGASGGIGGAIVEALADDPGVAQVYAGSRTPLVDVSAKVTPFTFDLEDEASIAAVAARVGSDGPVQLIFVATGVLQQDETLRPEKSWSAQSPAAYARAFAINATGPALIGKHFLPLLAKDSKTVFAALSARVGSISDNRLGGWHAYRASKAALNMIVRNFALELAVRNKQAVAVTLHPGTVETSLSAPFQKGMVEGKLFTPAYSADCLLGVIDALTVADNGQCLAWNGSRIPF